MAKSGHYNFHGTEILAASLLMLGTLSHSTMADKIRPETTDLSEPEYCDPDTQPPVSNITNNLDSIHHNIFLRLQRPAQRVDDFFCPKDSDKRSTTISEFRLGLYVMLKDKEKFSARFEPKIDADIRLPNLEERWGIFVDSIQNNDLPGTDPTERKSSLNTGIRRTFNDWKLHADVGVRWRSGPAGMTRLAWRPDFSIGKTKFYPRQKIFYESWDGLGEMTSLTVNRTMGYFFTRLVSGAKYTQSTDGVEWEQTAIIGHASKLIDDNKSTDLIADNDVARGLSFRYSMFGHGSRDQKLIDRHRLTLVYRHPMYKDWMFFQIAPGVEWLDENDWSATPSVQIGIDTLFWELTKSK